MIISEERLVWLALSNGSLTEEETGLVLDTVMNRGKDQSGKYLMTKQEARLLGFLETEEEPTDLDFSIVVLNDNLFTPQRFKIKDDN